MTRRFAWVNVIAFAVWPVVAGCLATKSPTPMNTGNYADYSGVYGVPAPAPVSSPTPSQSNAGPTVSAGPGSGPSVQPSASGSLMATLDGPVLPTPSIAIGGAD